MGDLEKKKLAALQDRPAWLGLSLSPSAGFWLPLATPMLMPQAGCNRPCWPGSTLGCETWLSRHLGEWGNCHPGAWGLGRGQWGR